MTKFHTTSPADGSIYYEGDLASPRDIDAVLDAAVRAQRSWKAIPLEKRVQLLSALTDAVERNADALARELTLQMGRPIRDSPGELKGFCDRARTMLRLAPDALADVVPPEKEGFTRFMHREPLGVVLVLAPWNYPWLTAVNAVVPALAAGNAVVLKHSDQTPLVAERFVEAGREAGLPEGIFSFVHASHDDVAKMAKDERVAFVAFTGSVEGGRAVHRAAADRFIAVGLELGGKDPAYVCADADLEFAAGNVIDGAMYNAGQSCCAIERVYVERPLFDRFVERCVAVAEQYVLGDPRKPDTTMGPVVRVKNAQAIRAQVDAAVARGARALVDAKRFGEHPLPYVAPQVLVDVDHSMDLMREETFGPVVGIMPVSSDDDAVGLMNDSRFGLTASIWTPDLDRARAIAERLETGTVFMNRCDYLDPELAWVGVKDSGRGVTLSRLGFEQLTRPKSFHFRHVAPK
jgi:acyl-CoA reductase-like NAD-dependent aldehyde dehydrogenase